MVEKTDISRIGKAGEDFCEKIYLKRGCKIIGRNYHSRFGEIDVIAETQEHIIFIEVKTRNEDALAEARESVTLQKQKKIILAALDFLQQNASLKQPRFDVLEVIHKNGRLCKYRMTENAFEYNERIHGRLDF